MKKRMILVPVCNRDNTAQADILTQNVYYHKIVLLQLSVLRENL